MVMVKPSQHELETAIHNEFTGRQEQYFLFKKIILLKNYLLILHAKSTYHSFPSLCTLSVPTLLPQPIPHPLL